MENAEINRCHLLGALESIIPLKGQGKQSEPIAANLLVSVGSGLMGGWRGMSGGMSGYLVERVEGS